MPVTMSSGIYGTLKAAVSGRLPDIREVNNVYIRACLNRGYFLLRARSIQVTNEGYEAYEAVRQAQVPMRSHVAPLSKTVLEHASWDLRAKLIEFGKRGVA